MKVEEKMKTLLHDVKSTLGVLENLLNGALQGPVNKDEYRDMFEAGKRRILKACENIFCEGPREEKDKDVKAK